MGHGQAGAGHGQAGAGHAIAARRSCSMPDPMAVAPPRDLTIPEHPEEHSSAAPGDCNLQARALPPGRPQEAARTHYGTRGTGSAAGVAPAGPLFQGGPRLGPGSAGQPRRGFGSGASAPQRAPASAAAAAAAALRVAPSPRSSLERLGRQGAGLASVRSSLERQGRSSSDRLQTFIRADRAPDGSRDGQEVPAMMR